MKRLKREDDFYSSRGQLFQSSVAAVVTPVDQTRTAADDGMMEQKNSVGISCSSASLGLDSMQKGRTMTTR